MTVTEATRRRQTAMLQNVLERPRERSLATYTPMWREQRIERHPDFARCRGCTNVVVELDLSICSV